MQETRVWSLGGEDPLEKEMTAALGFLPGQPSWRSLEGYSPQGHRELDMTEQLTLSFSLLFSIEEVLFFQFIECGIGI